MREPIITSNGVRVSYDEQAKLLVFEKDGQKRTCNQEEILHMKALLDLVADDPHAIFYLGPEGNMFVETTLEKTL